MKFLLPLAALAVVAAVPTFADCPYPKAPESLPDGATATSEEMVSGQKAVKAYDADVSAYLACRKLEYFSIMSKEAETLTPKEKKAREQAEVDKHNATVAELEAVAARFNEQVKIFKAKNEKNKG